MWYARHRGGFGYNLNFPLWELAIYDRQTGKVFPQTDLYGGAMRPVVSPDGKWLVYATRHDAETGLRLRNLTSGDEQWLVYPVQRDDQESRFTRDLMPGSSFTPDSKALVVSYGGKIWRADVPSGQTRPIPFTAHVHQDLGPLVRFDTRVDTGDMLVKQIRDAAPSPDGRRLAFSALDKVYVIDLPGGVPRRLTSDTVHEQVPTWSPDGEWIAYVTWSDRGGSVEKVRADARGGGKGAAPDARARLLRPPGVVARRPAHRGDQGPARSAHQRADRARVRAGLAPRGGRTHDSDHADRGRWPAPLQPRSEADLFVPGERRAGLDAVRRYRSPGAHQGHRLHAQPPRRSAAPRRRDPRRAGFQPGCSPPPATMCTS